ncbi:helix-turn-helix domain-containing protein [Streptomyces sp. NBC_00094]|uniref:helix-turn-helix domain-containing protein n=1 Tax=Streptomyces sp. NBC_00094 TaxID=2903620 RepID=UPI002254D6DD|nr:helix-turn-helix domain-containing protein [Streptomyces sp. NBC_00094]MCX5390560.1 helix-turn-helix transcriptional regulator [Streptomyces sp. NBC_00094]
MEHTWEGSLRALGLTEAEERVYRTAVTAGTSEPGGLADDTGIPPDQVVAVLGVLRAKGLMTTRPGGTGDLVPAAPDVALSSTLLTWEHELQKARIALAELTSAHRARERWTAGDAGAVETVTGAEAVAHWFRHLQRSATEEFLACTRGPYMAVHGASNGAEVAAFAERGVVSRGLIDRSVLADSSIHDELLAALDRGQDVRFVDELPVKMVIADRSLAMVPLATPGSTEPGAVVIRSSGLLDALLALFEQLWDRGVQLRDALDPDGGGTDFTPAPLDRRILALLLAGHTDEATGKQLGLARRTVQRRVSTLMEAANVHTRLQLGWHARDRGWL